jgi:hypothetical protein
VKVNGPLGIIHVAFGAAYVFPETTTTTSHSIGFLVALGVPVWVAGIPWIVSGLAAMAAAFVEAPPGRDGWGFQALVAVQVAWMVTFLFSWILGYNPRGGVWALVFGALGWATFTVSGMVDARRLTPPGVS